MRFLRAAVAWRAGRRGRMGALTDMSSVSACVMDLVADALSISSEGKTLAERSSRCFMYACACDFADICSSLNFCFSTLTWSASLRARILAFSRISCSCACTVPPALLSWLPRDVDTQETVRSSVSIKLRGWTGHLPWRTPWRRTGVAPGGQLACDERPAGLRGEQQPSEPGSA